MCRRRTHDAEFVCCGAWLLWELGRCFTIPASWTLELGAIVFARPVIPGRWDQCSTPCQERCYRALLVIPLLLILLPLALALGPIGALLRAFAGLFRPQ